MKTAISIPEDMYQRAEQAAKRLGVSRSEFYRRAIGDFLQRNDDQRITDALNEVYKDHPEESRLDPVVLTMQFSSLEPEQW